MGRLSPFDRDREEDAQPAVALAPVDLGHEVEPSRPFRQEHRLRHLGLADREAEAQPLAHGGPPAGRGVRHLETFAAQAARVADHGRLGEEVHVPGVPVVRPVLVEREEVPGGAVRKDLALRLLVPAPAQRAGGAELVPHEPVLQPQPVRIRGDGAPGARDRRRGAGGA